MVSFGGLKTPGTRLLADHYKTRLSWILKVQEIELKRGDQHLSRVEIQKRETEQFLNLVAQRKKNHACFTMILDESAPSYPSSTWSQWLTKHLEAKTKQWIIGIGSDVGFLKDSFQQVDQAVSFGQQTFPHEIARILVFEQWYRALSILQKHPYHREG